MQINVTAVPKISHGNPTIIIVSLIMFFKKESFFRVSKSMDSYMLIVSSMKGVYFIDRIIKNAIPKHTINIVMMIGKSYLSNEPYMRAIKNPKIIYIGARANPKILVIIGYSSLML